VAGLLLLLLLSSGACGRDESPALTEAPEPEETPPPAARFVDISEEAQIDFTHFNAASDERLLPETMGSGAAFFDYDNDGDPDLYLVNGANLTGDPLSSPPGALYQNLGDGRFRHVTTVAGLDRPMFGMGAAVGDVDNDGWTDLFIAGLGGDRLYRNLGTQQGGAVKFEDVTAAFGLADGGTAFSSSAAFLDYDRDGFLDLYVARYVEWSVEADVECSPDGEVRTYCTPEVYDGAPNRLFRNTGGEGFSDVTEAAGLWKPESKSLGVVVFDHDRDGWPDLAVANDTTPNTLWVNQGTPWRADNGKVTFEEIGVEAGFAHSESGATRGGMGIDAGDVDGDGVADVAVGNFAQEMTALYRGAADGTYSDDAAQRGVGLPTVRTLAFGTLLFDQDGDGDLDLAVVNGHIEPDIAETGAQQTYAQPPQLFENQGGEEARAAQAAKDVKGEGEAGGDGGDEGGADDSAADDGAADNGAADHTASLGHFEEIAPVEGDALAEPLVGRGLAAADVDDDGDLDLLVTQNGGPARLYRNQADPRAWLRVHLVGTESNRNGYGARVRVVAEGRQWERTLRSGGSYLSANEPVLTFGLDGVTAIDRVEVTWPSGREQTVEEVELNQRLTIEESAD